MATFESIPRGISEAITRDVQEAAAVGGPDDFHGEVVVAFVALKEDEEISSEALIAYCEESLVKYKVPQKIIFLDTLPKKGPGKIDKLSLKTLAA